MHPGCVLLGALSDLYELERLDIGGLTAIGIETQLLDRQRPSMHACMWTLYRHQLLRRAQKKLDKGKTKEGKALA
jgi:hypothetical protein